MPKTFGNLFDRFGPYGVPPYMGGYYDPFCPAVSGSRLLYHSGLANPSQRLVVYPYLPEETDFFMSDVHAGRDIAQMKTQRSNFVHKFDRVLDDTVIIESFRPEGGLAAEWEFILDIERMWLNDPDWDNGEYLIWRPFDRTQKAYAVDIIKITVGGDVWKPEYKRGLQALARVGDKDTRRQQMAHSHWAVNQFEIHLKVRVEDPPQASLFAVGGSELPTESGLFNVNE